MRAIRRIRPVCEWWRSLTGEAFRAILFGTSNEAFWKVNGHQSPISLRRRARGGWAIPWIVAVRDEQFDYAAGRYDPGREPDE